MSVNSLNESNGQRSFRLETNRLQFIIFSLNLTSILVDLFALTFRTPCVEFDDTFVLRPPFRLSISSTGITFSSGHDVVVRQAAAFRFNLQCASIGQICE